MGMIIGLLPEPHKGYLGIISRYRRIWTTVGAEAFVYVFVLGVCAWLRCSWAIVHNVRGHKKRNRIDIVAVSYSFTVS
jgi:hypothetical protein